VNLWPLAITLVECAVMLNCPRKHNVETVTILRVLKNAITNGRILRACIQLTHV
jgi:hypothetical protein